MTFHEYKQGFKKSFIKNLFPSLKTSRHFVIYFVCVHQIKPQITSDQTLNINVTRLYLPLFKRDIFLVRTNLWDSLCRTPNSNFEKYSDTIHTKNNTVLANCTYIMCDGNPQGQAWWNQSRPVQLEGCGVCYRWNKSESLIRPRSDYTVGLVSKELVQSNPRKPQGLQHWYTLCHCVLWIKQDWNMHTLVNPPEKKNLKNF